MNNHAYKRFPTVAEPTCFATVGRIINPSDSESLSSPTIINRDRDCVAFLSITSFAIYSHANDARGIASTVVVVEKKKNVTLSGAECILYKRVAYFNCAAHSDMCVCVYCIIVRVREHNARVPVSPRATHRSVDRGGGRGATEKDRKD